MYTPYIVDDNTRGESLEFVISRSQVQIPSVAPLKNQAPMRFSRGCCFFVMVNFMLFEGFCPTFFIFRVKNSRKNLCFSHAFV